MKTKSKVNFSLQKFDEDKFQIKVNWTYGYKTFLTGNSKAKYEYLKFSTGFTLPSPDFWDVELNRVVGMIPNKSFINMELDKLEDRILLLYNDYIRSGVLPAPGIILSQLQNEKPIQQFQTKTRFFDFVTKHAEDSNYTPNTVKSYHQYANKLLAFENKLGRTIFIEDYDRKMHKEFINFLYSLLVRKKVNGKTIEMSRSENDIFGYNKSTKIFLKEAKLSKIKIAFDEFKDEIKVKRIDIDAVYFDDKKIKTLFEFDCIKSGRPGLQNTWLWLLISCMTGLRYSDWSKLLTPNIKEEKIKGKNVKILIVRQQKTDTLVKIPIYNRLYKLFEKYDFKLPAAAGDLGKVSGLSKTFGFGVTGLLTEGSNAQQFVGSATYTVNLSADKKSLNFTIYNQTSEESFKYHNEVPGIKGTSHNREDNPIEGTISQTFQFSEPIKTEEKK